MSILFEEIPDTKEIVRQKIAFDWPYQLKEKLSFPRGVLKLLKETELFGPVIEQALEDIDSLSNRLEELEALKSLEIRIEVKKPANL